MRVLTERSIRFINEWTFDNVEETNVQCWPDLPYRPTAIAKYLTIREFFKGLEIEAINTSVRIRIRSSAM